MGDIKIYRNSVNKLLLLIITLIKTNNYKNKLELIEIILFIASVLEIKYVTVYFSHFCFDLISIASSGKFPGFNFYLQ